MRFSCMGDFLFTNSTSLFVPLNLPFENCLTASDTPFSQFFSSPPRFSSSLPLWLGLFLPQKVGFFSSFCQILWCPFVLVCSKSPTSAPFFASRILNTFCTISRLLLACPFFLPSHGLPNDAFSICPNFIWQEFWSSTTSWHLHVFASSSISHTSIHICFLAPLCSMLHTPNPLVNETPLFFWLRLELFTIFPFLHQTVEASRMLQSYIHLLSLLLHCISSRFCQKAFIHQYSCFCRLISLLITFGDEPLKLRHLFFFFLRAVCLHMCHFHQDASFDQFMWLLQFFKPQPCISGSWLDTFFLSFS